MNYVFDSTLWEIDFILNDILPKGTVHFIESLSIQNCDVLVFSCKRHTYEGIQSIIKELNPKIIIMLSDEYYEDNKFIYNSLGNECELFLRQYHHFNYKYTSNTLHLPLGYTNGCKVFQEDKKFKWSFFGAMKSDRNEMLSHFRQLTPYLIGDSMSKEIMCRTYSQSLFVPCGRGNSSLDCFRLYEASMNGAIPVVVGSDVELKNTFLYEMNPPWIFAHSWNDAVNQCLNTSLSSDDVYLWWKQRVRVIQERVLSVLF